MTPMTTAAELYDWLVFLHIVAAMIWFGGLVALTVLAAHVLRGVDADALVRFVRSLRVVGPTVLAPAVIALLGIGVWLVLDSDAWDFGQTWIVLALGLFAAAFVVGAAFQSRAVLGAERAAATGDYRLATHHLRRWSWGMGVILLLLVAATWDMVFKPGL